MNRVIWLGLIMLLGLPSLQAQLAVQLGFVRPQGLYGAEIKPTIGPEIMFGMRPESSTRAQLWFAFGLYPHLARQDVFRTIHQGNSTTNDPDWVRGSRSYAGNLFVAVPISMIYDQRLFYGDFSPFVGIDAGLNLSLYLRDFVDASISSQDDGDLNASIAPRVGFYYDFNETWTMMSGLSRAISLARGEPPVGHYKLFFGVFKQIN